jgi:hypothetical protein
MAERPKNEKPARMPRKVIFLGTRVANSASMGPGFHREGHQPPIFYPWQGKPQSDSPPNWLGE